MVSRRTAAIAIGMSGSALTPQLTKNPLTRSGLQEYSEDMGKAKRDGPGPETAEAQDHGPAGEPRPAGDRSETLLNILLLALFLLLCAVSWWLVKRQAFPGAPGAPTGRLDGGSERPACIVVRSR